jgi:DNA-binding response OmpR family regulator
LRLLLVEDDGSLSERMIARLSLAGFVTSRVASAEEALRLDDLGGAAILIVDIGLPGLDGISFVRELRSRGHEQPVLMLTARGDWQQKVDGLNAGADDYVVKPVRPEELIARLHALLRRAAGQAGNRIVAGPLVIDPQARTALLDGVALELTQIEFRLLHLFALRAGHVLSHAEIQDHLYLSAQSRSANAVEVHIARLRRKIGHEAIRTIRGLGYRLAA